MTNSSGIAAPMTGHAHGATANPLANEDLLPTTPAQRHWGWKDFAALWVGMVVCVPTYTMASSMLDFLNMFNVLFTTMDPSTCSYSLSLWGRTYVSMTGSASRA